MGMKCQMHGGARRRRHGEKGDETQRAETARDRRAECEQPHGVESEMRPVAVDQRVGDEGPDLRAESARHRALRQDRCVVARRNEREQQQKFDVLLRRQHPCAQRVNEHEHREGCGHDGGNVEDRLGSSHVVHLSRQRSRDIGWTAVRGKQHKKREGSRPPFVAFG